MLKQRIIGVLPVRDGIVVQSIGFKRYLPVGKPAVAVEHLNRWGVDEIVMLDISPPGSSQVPLQRHVADVAPYCLVPLAVGGGVRNVEQIRELIKSGADRVVLNTAVLDDPKLLTQAADRFGVQCVIAAIDAMPGASGYDTYVDYGHRKTGLSPAEMAKRAQEHGAGEILIQAMHRDGMRNGYDLDLAKQVTAAVSVPVVVLGGAGSPAHMEAAARLPGVCGLGAGNYLHFTEHTAAVAKAALDKDGFKLRHDSYADYRGFAFGPEGRLAKQDEGALEELLFVHYVDDVI